MANSSIPNFPARVLVLGQPGIALHATADGAIACRLDGERHVDLWHPTQVEVRS